MDVHGISWISMKRVIGVHEFFHGRSWQLMKRFMEVHGFLACFLSNFKTTIIVPYNIQTLPMKRPRSAHREHFNVFATAYQPRISHRHINLELSQRQPSPCRVSLG